MKSADWLACFAAVLGVSLAHCKKEQVAAQAREVPAPTFKIPSPYDTVCSVTVQPRELPPFVVGVGGDADGVCFGPPPPNPHPSANCGPAPGVDAPCADRKPWKPNLRAVVRARALAQASLDAPLKAALAKILACVTGPWTHHATLEVDATGKVKTSSTVACVAEAFDAMKLSGADSIVIDLTST